jgi:hypothetical protein
MVIFVCLILKLLCFSPFIAGFLFWFELKFNQLHHNWSLFVLFIDCLLNSQVEDLFSRKNEKFYFRRCCKLKAILLPNRLSRCRCRCKQNGWKNFSFDFWNRIFFWKPVELKENLWSQSNKSKTMYLFKLLVEDFFFVFLSF